ncbi:MAG: hypothetical protein ILP22_04710 [Oscillospiraceae bacterium]|nr:hypothetical protein [Oscillospiraceae bacterium]
MTGLIKMYLYRMSRSVGLVISLVICCLCVFIPALEHKISILRFFIGDNTSTVSTAALHVLTAGVPCAVCAIYLSAVFSADHANGFIKNIIPAIKHKSTVFTARTTVTVLFATVAYLLVCTFSFLYYGVIQGKPVGLEALYIKMFILVYVMTLAFLMLLNTMTIFTRGMVMAVIFAISSMTGFTMLPVGIGETVIFGITNPNREAVVYTYLVSYMMKNISYELNTARALAMSAVYIIISVAVSLSVLSLRDEK